MARKVRINLTIDEEVWKEIRAELKKRGYPRGVPSWLAQKAFEDTLILLEHDATNQLDMFLDFRRDDRERRG